MYCKKKIHKYLMHLFNRNLCYKKKKIKMPFAIKDNIKPYLGLPEIYLKNIAIWLAGLSVSNCAKVYACIQSKANWIFF